MPKLKRSLQALEQETLTPPDKLSEAQKIARVKNAAGNNLYRLELPSGEGLLAELPARFRSTIWIRRGSFVLVDTSSSADRDNKLGGEIVNVVRDNKAWMKAPFWPREFVMSRSIPHPDSDDEEDDRPTFPPSDDESD